MTTANQLQPPRPPNLRRASKDPAHLPLHRRLLFPYHGLDASLPKLVEGNGEDVASINERLYHLIALALRAYVLSWYTRISPRDRALIPSINNTILTPLLQPILTSLHDDSSTLLDLVLLDLPTVIELHIKTYREAVHNTKLGYGPVADAYHARFPLQSVVKEGDRWELSPLYYTSLADGVLKNGLSVEEYGSTVERLMARELLGRMVLGGVGKKLSEDWFWYSLLLKLLGEPRDEGTINEDTTSTPKSNIAETVSTWVIRIWSMMTMMWTAIIALAAFHSGAPVPQERYHGCLRPWLSVVKSLIGYDENRSGKPIMARLLLGMVDCFALLSSPIIDRTLPHFLQTRLLTPQTSIKVIDLLERILFPLDGYPAPTPPDPTPEEIIIMRKELETRIDKMIPELLRSTLLPGGSASLLDCLSSTECNAHLVAMVLDTVVAAIIPDLILENR